MGGLAVCGQEGGVVGGARDEDGGVVRGRCGVGNEDNGVKFDAVAHRDHHDAAGVVVGVLRDDYGGGGFGGESWVFRLGLG